MRKPTTITRKLPIEGCTNPLADNYNPLANSDNGSCEFTPQNIVAIINDGYPIHAEQMMAIWLNEYGESAELFNFADNFLMEFSNGVGCDTYIKSYPQAYSYLPIQKQYYPNVQMFFPLGDNASVEILYPQTLCEIVLCGAGGENDTQNMTAYGNGLEFWDNEAYYNPIDESSYSNPIIASKLKKIKEARECGWWEARYCARITADRNEPNRPANTIWHNLNGFGKINVANAIAYNGSIPPDPYLNNGNVYTPFEP